MAATRGHSMVAYRLVRASVLRPAPISASCDHSHVLALRRSVVSCSYAGSVSRSWTLCPNLHAHTSLPQRVTLVGIERAGQWRGFATGASDSTYSDPRPAVLDAALRYVGSHGWSRDAIAAACSELGLSPASAGVFDSDAALAHHAMRRATADMNAALASMDLASMSVNDRIVAGVQARLNSIRPYSRTWAQAMALGALPANLPTTLELLGQACDDIWWHAGDRSTDMNWYSRRGLLLAIYSASEVYMLTDMSRSGEDTSAFVRRAVRDASTLGRDAGETLAMAQAVASGVGALATAVFDVVRPAVLIPGQVLTTVSRAMPGVPSHTGAAGPNPAAVADLAATVLSPALSVVATAANAVNSAARSAGIRLPEPSPMITAMLAIAQPATQPSAAPAPQSVNASAYVSTDAPPTAPGPISPSTAASSVAAVRVDSVGDVARAAGLIAQASTKNNAAR